MDKQVTVRILEASLVQAEAYQEECRVRHELAREQVQWIYKELARLTSEPR